MKLWYYDSGIKLNDDHNGHVDFQVDLLEKRKQSKNFKIRASMEETLISSN